MLASYEAVVRRAVGPTVAVAAVIVAVSAVLVGTKGLIGALLGVALVIVFFGISIVVVGRAARISQPAMMVAALASFLVKIVALAAVLSTLNGTTAFSLKALGFTAIGCILAWNAAQVIAATRVKMLYVDPEPPQQLPQQQQQQQQQQPQQESDQQTAQRSG
jgi:ATP synthase protein I